MVFDEAITQSVGSGVFFKSFLCFEVKRNLNFNKVCFRFISCFSTKFAQKKKKEDLMSVYESTEMLMKILLNFLCGESKRIKNQQKFKKFAL